MSELANAEEVVKVVTHTAPEGGIPEAAFDFDHVNNLLASLRAGDGALAIDAERASGYRYSQRAYLVQFGRNNAGVHLLDPLTEVPLEPLREFVNGTPWILHAATQDLPCLRELGFHPTSVYDTELAGKLLGRSKVGLAALLEEELNVVLAKEHSAVDWSTRPLPDDWRAYAALDVEFLVALHDRLLAALAAANRLHWYEQERALLLSFTGPAVREEPWRRVSGIHVIRDARKLAIVRALWTARDARARELDISAGRVLHDSIIVEVARQEPQSQKAMEAIRPVHSRNVRKDPNYWWAVVASTLALEPDELPRKTANEGTLPPPRTWAQRNPDAFERWERVRPRIVATAETYGIQPEILMHPETVRRLCWEGFVLNTDDETVAALMAGNACRPWQVEALASEIADALRTD